MDTEMSIEKRLAAIKAECERRAWGCRINSRRDSLVKIWGPHWYGEYGYPDALDKAETFLAATDPDAEKIHIHAHGDGFVSVDPAPDGYEYVLVKRKVSK